MLKIHSFPTAKWDFYKISLNGQSLLAEHARVSAMPFNMPWPGHQRDLNQTEDSGFISFEGDEAVTVSVEAKGEIQKAIVRPIIKNVKVKVTGNTAVFTLDSTGSYVLEINGQHSPLHIFFNPLRDFAAESKAEIAAGRKVYYYGQGLHNIGHLTLPSHSTVTIDAGAVVLGSISAFGAEDAKINGYEILDGSNELRTDDTAPVYRLRPTEGMYFENDRAAFEQIFKSKNSLHGLLRFYFCKNVTFEGVILRDCSNFALVPAACEDVTIDRIKTIGMWRYNSDGIDIFNSQRVTVKNCFCEILTTLW